MASKKRKLYIDCQILQTAAFDRGMGKYTLSLVAAMLEQNNRSKQYDEIEVLFNSNLNCEKSRIDAIMAGFVYKPRVGYLSLPTQIDSDHRKKYKEASKILTKYLDNDKTKQATDVDFLITAPFFIGFASAFPANPSIKKYSIVYDLIPQKIWAMQRIFPDDLYFYHYRLFLEADGLLTISHAVKDDLAYFGIQEQKMTSIDGAPFARTESKTSSISMTEKLKTPYILMVSAPIVHKNNERAVQAFARFNQKQQNQYHLYITSNFDDTTRNKLQDLGDNIHFTGNISDEELVAAYKSAEAVFFPSLSEGLGMPVLEASVYGVPVACSDIPVLSEISDDAFYQFDPLSVSSIASSLEQAVTRQDWTRRKQSAVAVLKKYSWTHSAEKALRHMVNAPLVSRFNELIPLNIVAPRPSIGSPAGYLAERLYMTLQEPEKISFQMAGPNKVKRPSYISNVELVDSSGGTQLEVRDASLFFSKTKKVKLSLRMDNGDHCTRTVLARPIVEDRVLNINGWQFESESGDTISFIDLLNSMQQEGHNV